MSPGTVVRVDVDPEEDIWLGQLSGRAGVVVKEEEEPPGPGRRRRKIFLVHLFDGVLEWLTEKDVEVLTELREAS